jgi:hypothetical protein
MADVSEDVQRWTAKRRVALVLSIVRGETSVAEAARKHGLTVAEIDDWQQRFAAGPENILRARPKDEEALPCTSGGRRRGRAFKAAGAVRRGATSAGRWISPTSTVAPTAGRILRP